MCQLCSEKETIPFYDFRDYCLSVTGYCMRNSLLDINDDNYTLSLTNISQTTPNSKELQPVVSL